MRVSRAAAVREEIAPAGKIILASGRARARRGADRLTGDRNLAVLERANCSMAFSDRRSRRDAGHLRGRLQRMIFLL